MASGRRLTLYDGGGLWHQGEGSHCMMEEVYGIREKAHTYDGGGLWHQGEGSHCMMEEVYGIREKAHTV